MLNNKLAAYLDEAGDEPRLACETLKKHGINHVALRYVWTGNIGDVADKGLNDLRNILTGYGLETLMIASTVGQVDASKLHHIPADKIDHIFDLAAYFNAKYVRFFVGNHTVNNMDQIINDWLNKIATRAISNNVIPVLELTHDTYYQQPATVATMLSQNKKWRLLYDPAQLIVRKNIDPFVRYWTLLKNYVDIIDIHDFKVGQGFKPPGFGGAMLKETLTDARSNNYKGWYILEPCLGRKFGSANSKAETFAYCMDGLNSILDCM